MQPKLRRFAANGGLPIVAFLGVLILAIHGLFSRTVLVRGAQAQKGRSDSAPAIPKTWDDEAMATLEVPLANPIGSPKHVLSAYYYKIPVRPIYKSYPIYAPGHEPPGYMEWLKQQEAVIVWDDKGPAPSLVTETDWIRAGEIIFDAPIFFGDRPVLRATDVRDPAWYQKTGTPVAKDGTMPFAHWVVRKKGQVELGTFACGTCHTRVMPGGNVLKGAQGNFPFGRSVAYRIRADFATTKDPKQLELFGRASERGLYSVPWLQPDPLASIEDAMPVNQIASAHEAIPPGVLERATTPARSTLRRCRT